MNYAFLANTLLFRGISEEEIKSVLPCLGSYEKELGKGEVIFRAGDYTESMGLLLAGGVTIEMDDLWGNKTILGHAGIGDIFAETYACLPGEPLMVTVVAAEKSRVLFLNAARLMTPCQSSCAHHNRLIQNLFRISAERNLAFSRRSLHTAPKSIRGRLLSYLSEQAKLAGRYEFTIPYNRQQLADYLGVDRSALSNELSKMRRDGLLNYSKSNFTLNSLSL